MKPRITKSGDGWHCYGAGLLGLGNTPFYAYLDWKAFYDKAW